MLGDYIKLVFKKNFKIFFYILIFLRVNDISFHRAGFNIDLQKYVFRLAGFENFCTPIKKYF